MNTILLTGGSGFIGHWVARLLPPHLTLRILARPYSDLSLLDRANVRYERVTGDLLDPTSLLAALEGVEGVIHAAGYISFDRRRATQIRLANLEATLNLFRACGAQRVSRVVYTASIFALGHAKQGLVTRESAFNAGALLDIPYVQAKREAELAARDWMEQGLPLVRVYPGLCLGPEDRTRSSSSTIGEWLRGRLPVLVEGGICYLDVRDAAAAHVAALLQGEVGAQYLIPGYNLTHYQLFEQLAPLAGKQLPWLTVPAPLAELGAGLLERLIDPPPLYRDMARLMRYRWWYDGQSSEAALGIHYRPLEETLRVTLAELRDAATADKQKEATQKPPLTE
ncbi:MAG: NAD-dependent epimerase/dehydratase family protein [Ardenticatenales bacterium]|nr:NAD-dependent epimerase/dehydratase family protein [Ardenticatenales bacterium]